MLFEPYVLWPEPRVIAYQRDDPKHLELLLAQSAPGTQLIYHCPGHDGRAFFAHLEQLQARVPHVRFHLAANTHAELRQYRDTFRLPSTYGPVSLFTDERIFQLQPEAEPDTDAIYVARFEPGLREHCKRLPLARQVQSLRIVTFCLGRSWGFRAPFYQTFPELAHAPVNDHLLTSAQVARELRRSRVQLALSQREGCMLAFTEGLLCGVPAVSTRCQSARTELFNDLDVMICDDDAGSIASSVARMLLAAPERRSVRERALARLREMRREYLEYVSNLTGVAAMALDAHIFGHADGPHRLRFELGGPRRSPRGARRHVP